MSENIRQLEPKPLWNHFADLNAIPRPSKKEERVIAFMKKFGDDLKLETMVDKAGNVIIKKPSTRGMEGKATIVLQSHLDMVHQKNSDTQFDFDKEGINMFVDGDWVKAKGTTLGADNGIGVASIMAVLASDDIPHPAIEALFTIDEETGMTGALSLEGGILNGKYLLNLDTEEDNELTIGCAGGLDVTASGTYKTEKAPGDHGLQIKISGLTGGHSGTDIHRGRANANKLMNRLLLHLVTKTNCRISSVDGGSLRNAIPRESVAVVAIDKSRQDDALKVVNNFKSIFKKEYDFTDPNLDISCTDIKTPGQVCGESFQNSFLNALYSCPNGIYRMTPSIEGLVQSSNNIARVQLGDGKITVMCLTRSSVNTEKDDLAQSISSAFSSTGAEITTGGAYPGWEPKPGSELVKLMTKVYSGMFNEEPHVNAVHAGLECGIIGRNYPDMEMISFGPNIYGAHSPDERVQISSVQKFWKYFLEVLKQIPDKES
jgi:dipeptidase D